MILAIDIGNSNVVVGCIGEGGPPNILRMVTDRKKTEDEYAVGVKQLLEFNGINPGGFEGAIISSVVPQLTEIFKSAVQKITGHDALIVGAGLKTGLNILIDNPGQLGADLVAGSVAALDMYKPPIIMIDVGTATTIAVINEHSNYLGGVIFPGVALAMDALTGGTSLLQKVQIEAPEKVIGSNTIDAMKSGAVFGNASMIDGMIQRIEAELGMKATVVATGGIAPRLIEYCRSEIIYDEDLLLRGLGIIYHKNKKGRKQ